LEKNMASTSLGTLTLDLIAKIGGFTGPLDRATQSAKKNMNEIKVSTIAAGVAIGELAANMISAVPGAIQHLITGAAESAKEITNLSRVAGLSTTDFQKLAAGAATVGVEQDKLSDILKDVNDKVGDFMNTGGGAMKDFFTNIAPKVGVTADQFKKLNSAEALQLYVSSLQKANVNQAEMTFYMEAIANDATALVPLLKNNGQAFTELGNAAQAAGAIMSGETIQAAQDFNNQLLVLGQYVDAAKISLAAEFLPLVAQFSKDVNQAAKDGGGLTKVIGELGESLVSTTAFIASAADGVVRVFGIAADTIVGLYSTAVGHMSSLMSDMALGLSKITFGDMSKEFSADSARLRDEANLNFGIAAQAASGIGDKLNEALAGDRFKKYWAEAKASYAEMQKLRDSESTGGGKGSGVDPEQIKKDADAAKKALADAAAAAKKLQGAFDTSLEAYQREIQLINTSVDARKNATEVAKLQFEIESGKLVGINAQQQQRLLGLAAELDAKKKLKQANEDEAKSAAYAATLAEANQTIKSGFDLELAGAGMGDKARDRLKQDLQIQQEFDSKMAELQKQRNSGDISKELYDKETGLLQEALASRVVIQQDYYNRVDQAQTEWMSGVADAWSNYKDQAADSAGQAKQLFANALSGTEDEIVSFVKTGKLSFKDLADSIIEDLLRIQVKKAAVGLLSTAASFLTGGSSALGQGTMTGSSEGAFVANAKGGVYDSPSLSSFSNGVYSSPQLFAFAKGAGVFGEAGPEAIMPLTRAADGSLGVRALGSGTADTQSGGVTNITVNVNRDGSASVESDTAMGVQAAQALRSTMIAVYKEQEAKSASYGGAIFKASQGKR
jgi:lambda family phage tail tape measure protein